MGHVTVARFKGNGDVEVGVFLLDVFCLGVKDALYAVMTPSEYEERVLKGIFAISGKEPLDLPTARKLVEEAVAYAERIGFAPHRDYRKARRVFGGINAADSNAIFTFGKNGKPFYIQGPHDTPLRCAQILKTLETRCGPGNYDYLLVEDAGELSDEFEDFDEDEER